MRISAKLKAMAMSAGVLALAAAWTGAAQATPVLRIDGNPATDIVDNGAGDLSSASDYITAAVTTASFTTDIQLAYSTDSLGHVLDQNIQFTADSVPAGGTLTLAVSDNNLSLPDVVKMLGSLGGTTHGTVSYAAYLDTSNILFGTGTTIFSALDSYPPAGFSQDFASIVSIAPGPVSVTLQVTITHPARSETDTAYATTGSAHLTVLPEPMTTALLGVGLLGLGLARRRMRR